MQAEHSICNSTVWTPLQLHMLPLLSCADLGRLTCCCRVMREFLSAASARIWQLAAIRALPVTHPGLAGQGVAAVQQAMRANMVCLQNLQRGVCKKRAELLMGVNPKPAFSPDATRLSFFASTRAYPNREVDIFTAAGDSQLRFGVNGSMRVQAWSADSSTILVVGEDGTGVVLCDSVDAGT